MDRNKVIKLRDKTRLKRKRKIRNKISGCSAIPRVTVFKSNKFIYAQAIDDVNGVTICSVDGAHLKFSSTKEDAKKAAKVFCEQLKNKNIEKVVFDRNGYLYYGVIAAFAEVIREHKISL
jgi:large subunit ribosomal protein L18